MKEYLGRTHQEFIRCSELELEERLGRPSALGDYLAYAGSILEEDSFSLAEGSPGPGACHREQHVPRAG